MIGSVIKYFRFSYDYVLWEIGYVNLLMLLATIPDFEADEKEKKNGTLNFDDDPMLLANYINNLK